MGTARVWSVAVAALATISLVGCGGSNDRRLAATVTDPGGQPANQSGNQPVSTPSTPPPPPPKQVSPECGALNTFQLLNYSVGLIDVQKEPGKKEEAIKALQGSGDTATAKVPELGPSIKMIIKHHEARFDGQDDPAPEGSDPTVKDAADKLGTWAKDHDC